MKLAKLTLLFVACVWATFHWSHLFHRAQFLQAHPRSSGELHAAEDFVRGTVGCGALLAVALVFWRPQTRIALRCGVEIPVAVYFLCHGTLGFDGWAARAGALFAFALSFWPHRTGAALGRVFVVLAAVYLGWLYVAPIWLGSPTFDELTDLGFYMLMETPRIVPAACCFGMAALSFFPASLPGNRETARRVLFVIAPSAQAMWVWMLWNLGWECDGFEFFGWGGEMLFSWAVFALYCMRIFEQRERCERVSRRPVIVPAIEPQLEC